MPNNASYSADLGLYIMARAGLKFSAFRWSVMDK